MGVKVCPVVAMQTAEMFASSNQALAMYHGLTHGAQSAISAHGTDAQKETYLPNMISCKWTGTMNLTEPHCGTDLGLMRTKAEANKPMAAIKSPDRRSLYQPVTTICQKILST